jgi:hypothetical protein
MASKKRPADRREKNTAELEKKFDKLDAVIKKLSKTSKKAPSEFIQAELRRWANTFLVKYSGTDYAERYLADDVEAIEEDYACYFETNKFKRRLKQTSWWKYTYAGCNGQIEFFLDDHGLDKLLEKLGLSSPFKPVRSVPASEINEPLRRYFIGIGYLYPQGETMLLHPNALFGQKTGRMSADSPFLSRDLIRCPYHEALHGNIGDALNDPELWQYWTDLCALTLAGLPQYTHYSPAHLRGEKFIVPDIRGRKRDYSPYLEYGRKLVPERYKSVGYKIENFEWVLPPKELLY